MDSVATSLYTKLRANGIRSKLVGGDGICTSELAKILNSALSNDDIYCAEAGGITAAEAPQYRFFETQYRERFGHDILLYAPYSYDAVKLLTTAIKSTGSVASKDIAEFIKKSKLNGITGSLDFDQRGDLNSPAFSVYTYRDGKRSLMGIIRP